MQIVMVSFATLAAIAFLASLVAALFGVGDRGDTLRGLAFLLFLPAVGLRTYAHFNPPTAEEIYEERYGPRTPAPLYPGRFVSYDASGASLIVEVSDTLFLTVLDFAAHDALKLGKWMRRDQSRFPSRDVALTVRMPLSDRYGGVTMHDVLTLTWPSAEWRKVQWDTVTNDRVVALAQASSVHPALRDDINKWCSVNAARRWQGCVER